MPLFYSPLPFYWRTPGPILLLCLRYSNLRAIASFRSRSRLLAQKRTSAFGPAKTAKASLGRFSLAVYIMAPMARRPIKLEFFEHPATCPYCQAKVTVVSLMERLLASPRICPACKREFFIEDGKAVRIPGERAKKPPKQERSRISKAEGSSGR